MIVPRDWRACVKWTAPGGREPPDCMATRMNWRVRSTAAEAMPAQALDHRRCATGIIVWAWILL